jgi:histidine triad (HIT) family protein
MSEQNCIFCQIVAGAMPATIVYRDEQATAFRDLNPVAPVHILIVTNRHIPSVDTAGAADEATFGHLFSVARTLAHDEGIADTGYRVVVNTGRAAGQSVFHVHMHLIGGRIVAWPPG